MHLNFTEPAGSGSGFIAFLRKHPKIRFAMRVSFFYIILMVVSVQLLSAGSGHSQGLEDIKVTIELEKGDLRELFKKIENQSGLFFGYQPNQIQSIEITIPKTTASVKDILDKAFANTSLAYRKEGYSVIVFAKGDEAIANAKEVTAIPLTGRITDKNGNPMPGVSVFVKGTGSGTVTDSEGRYTLDVSENDVIVFSFIGYKKVEELLNGRSTIDVSMEEDTTVLQQVEILSTNYFSTTKEKSTMNISKVDGKEIENQPVTTLMNALVGRTPGIEIKPDNGAPGAASVINIRGINSLNSFGSYPLYVIDGVQIDSRPLQSSAIANYGRGFDPLSTISPADIESIEVLKDAGATAIYGSRGANGVIRITTKRAKYSARTNFDLNFYQGVGQLSNKADLLNLKQYLAMRHEAFENSGESPSIYISPDLSIWDTTRTTDWQDVLLGGTAKITDIQGAFSGGTEYSSFRFGGGYHKETTIYPGDDFGFQRANAEFSFNHQSKDKKLEITSGVNFGWTKNRFYNNSNFVNLALTLPPNAPRLRNEDGTINWELFEYAPGYFSYTWQNPLANLADVGNNVTKSLLSNATISYEVLPGLKAKTVFSFSNMDNDESVIHPITVLPPQLRDGETGSASFSGNKRTSFMVEPQLLFERDLNKHSFNAIVGATWQESQSSFSIVDGEGYPSDAMLGTIMGATTVTHRVDDHAQYRYLSGYVHVGYAYNDRYLIDLTGRRDGSSRFGPGKRFGNFGAVSVGWIFSEETLMKAVGFLSFGKIRASHGITGNDQIGEYRYLNTYDILPIGYQDGVSLTPTALYNPNYAWEKTTKSEIGIEVGFFKNRVMIESAWYRNRSSSQLVNSPLAATTGFPSVLENFDATVQNTGFELTVSTSNIVAENFKWTSSFNLSAPRNKLIKFKGIEGSSYANRYKVGQPLNIKKLYKYKGINPVTGLHEVEDINDDGNFDEMDQVFQNPIGNITYSGLINTFSYKNIDLSFLIQFSDGVVPNVLSALAPGVYGNQSRDVLDRWQETGDNVQYQKFVSTNNPEYSYVTQSNLNYSSASFIRMKTLSIGYKFDTELLSKIKIQEARLYVQCQNVFTITKYNGLDPETGNNLPPLRMVTLGLQIKL